MNRTIGSALAVLGLVLSASVADEPAAVKRGETAAVMVEKGPVIDGTLADPAWAKCPPIELGEAVGGKPPAVRTTARLLFGPTHLYLAVECQEPDTAGMTTKVAERDGPVWSDDSVEFFVTGDPRERYYQFAFNSAGVFMDGWFKPGVQTDRTWNSTAEAKATVQPGVRWIVTAAIPLKELSAYVGEGQAWIVNINRNRRGGPGRAGMYSWARLESTDWKAVNDYGVVEGVNVPKRDDGVTRTAAAAPKPPKYIVPEEAGGVLVYKRIAEWNLPDTGKGTAGGIDLPIKGSKGLKLAFLARGTDPAVREAYLNCYDARARDNTTPKAYRWITAQWRPVLYRFSEFRYNSIPNSSIGESNDFRDLGFHGNKTDGKGELQLRNFVVYRGEDAQPPAAPQGLSATAAGDGVTLEWKPATDNVAVAGYAISRAPAGKDEYTKVGQAAETKFTDTPAEGGPYRYRVLAYDFQENLSPWSAAAEARAAGGAKSPEPTRTEADRAGYAESVRQIHAAGAGKVTRGRVLCFGDSLTYATNYAYAVASALDEFEAIPKGYPGQRTGFGAKKIDADLAETNPEFCLILLGTNNPKAEKNIADAMADIRSMAESCRKRGVVPVFGTIPPRGFTDPASKPEAAYNAALVATCRELKAPVAYLFEGHQESGIDRHKLLAGDGVHTISGGWDIMGAAWRNAMDQVLYALRDRP